MNHKSPKTGITTWSADCDSTWLFSSVKTDKLIEKVLTCTSNLCNSPSNMPNLDDVFLCNNGFYNNTLPLEYINKNNDKSTVSRTTNNYKLTTLNLCSTESLGIILNDGTFNIVQIRS